MSSVQRQLPAEPGGTTRRRPRGRDARIDALADAALAELREHGYEGLTVRNAARRAGLAPATAYTYFGSKDHLVAEVFWRRLQLLAIPAGRRASTLTRVRGALDNLIEVVTGEPALVAASTIAVLANGDPDVEGLRLRIGVRISEHLATALGEGGDPAVLRALNLAVSGALLQAGMGFLRYDELSPRLHEVARLLLATA